jgi:hypothetical protein
MKQILLGLLFMGIGGALMYRSYPITEMFGRNAWAERNVGGTRNLIFLIGSIFIIIGGLVLFGIVRVTNPTNELPEGFAV